MAMIMMNPTERQLLWDRKLALMDYNTEMISARMTGMEEGKINIARKMKSRGMSNDVIAQITELSEEEISKL
jgi:predicted transposase/invertase (TIGR01784 family)